MPPVLYLLDANVLIDANRDYYPIERVPEFWDWLLEMGTRGRIMLRSWLPPPPEDRPDPLVDWLKENRNAIVLDEEAGVDLVACITEQGYGRDLTDEEVEEIGRDPFLVAYALVDIRRDAS